MKAVKPPIREYEGVLIGQGFDSIVEAWSVYIFDETWQRLSDAKKYAQEKNNGSNQAYTVTMGGMEFQIKPHGGDGKTFLLSNDLYNVDISNADEAFNISIKHLSCALWQYGPAKSREIISEALLKEMRPRAQEGKKGAEGWQRISRADYAFDFDSPDFTKEVSFAMADRLVAHSSCKARHDFKGPDNHDGYVMGTTRRVQTITIGNKKHVQIQLYDKAAEIKERSGKQWMYKVWEKGGYERESSKKKPDIWRLEVRFGRDYLNEEGVNTYEDLKKYLGGMLKKALRSRRLVDGAGDTNMRRWPTHPLWYLAWQEAEILREMEPIGKQPEYKAYDAVKKKNEQDMAAIMRRAAVLECGAYDPITARNFALEVLASLEKDENHEDAVERYQEKLKYVGCSRG